MQSIKYAGPVVLQTNAAAPINVNARTSFNQTGPGGIFVADVRSVSGHRYSTNLVHYDMSNSEFIVNTGKTFVIDHPLHPRQKYLVHACLEGPEAAVFYRGRGEITNHKRCTIHLPPYVIGLASDFTVHLTPIAETHFQPSLGQTRVYYATEVADNAFDVLGENGQFFWIVHGRRHDIRVEVDKVDVTLHGSGPYQWLESEN